MTVAELIAQLQTLPQDHPVYFSEGTGCNECNPLAIDNYEEVSVAYVYKAHINGIRKDSVEVVLLAKY